MGISKEDVRQAINNGLYSAGQALGTAGNWCRENPILAAAGLVGFREVVKAANRRAKYKSASRMIWDPSARHYWEVKREIRQTEWLEIERRKRLGESLGQILRDMNLLK